jgi:transcriptional regulator with XRE-family HTH domain
VSLEQELSLGTQLRRLREATRLTQEELAFRAGLTPNAGTNLERGKTLRPYPYTVRRIWLGTVALIQGDHDQANLWYFLEGLAVVAGIRGMPSTRRGCWALRRGCWRRPERPSTTTTNPSARSTSVPWPTYVLCWVRRASRRLGSEGETWPSSRQVSTLSKATQARRQVPSETMSTPAVHQSCSNPIKSPETLGTAST